jgi:hypothetical protein
MPGMDRSVALATRTNAAAGIRDVSQDHIARLTWKQDSVQTTVSRNKAVVL